MKNFKFEKMTDNYNSIFENWINEEHLIDLKTEIKDHFKKDAFVVLLQDKPIGMIRNFNRDGDSEISIEHFIGIPEFINKGIGSLFVKKFTDDLLKSKKIKKISADPKILDLRAQKSLIKAGFKFGRKNKDDEHIHMIKSA